jgi:hypothetical protein
MSTSVVVFERAYARSRGLVKRVVGAEACGGAMAGTGFASGERHGHLISDEIPASAPRRNSARTSSKLRRVSFRIGESRFPD